VFFAAATAQTAETVETLRATSLQRDTTILLEEVVVTSQHGEQRLLDIPASITVVNARTLENAHVVNMEQLAGFVPGLNVLVQTPGRPNLVIRGLTSDEVSPTAQPRVSVYLNGAPVSRATMAITELYDMERIEVMKGPQGTLFGRGAQAGVISFITRKPSDSFGGYVTAGAGNFNMKHIEGALNTPLTANGLAGRFAGIYSYHDGYVKNTSGGLLNDKNTLGGRFALSYAPQAGKLKADLTVNYQKDNNAGTAFMSKKYANANGVADIFKYEATLDRDGDFYNRREVLATILNVRYYTDMKNYFSSITSIINNSADSRFDGDGTAAPAIDMAERGRAKQFMQELRYNFSYGNRFTGIAGVSFWREDVSHKYTFRPDEQYLAALMMKGFDMEFLLPPGYQMIVDGKPNPLPALSVPPGVVPQIPNGIFMALPSRHVEDNYTEAVNSAYDLFFDAAYEIVKRLTLTAGVRGTFEHFTITNRASMVEGEPSVLGAFSGRSPNFFFKPVDNHERKESFSALTWRAGLKYELDTRSNVYAGYARGRRPNVLQYDAQGQYEVIDPETLHSFDAGYRIVSQRFMFDAALYYNKYTNFQSWRWEGMDYRQQNIDKATSCGAELSTRCLLNSNINLFGNYTYAHTAFDDRDNDGRPQLNRGNSFRLTPVHSFLFGLTAGTDISGNIRMSLTPSYSWKSHIFFEDANDKGIEQDAYGLLNANLAIRFKQQGLTLSLFGSNLTGEKYLIGAGNMGAMFGIPTFVPGAPRMMGVKLTWNF
jgi:outer membrane receptor protein involved in Fe transport